MKKRILLLCSIFILMGAISVSCKKSNAQLLDEYRETLVQIKAASEKHDIDEMKRLNEKSLLLEAELEKRSLSQEEQIEYSLIMAESFLNTIDLDY